MFFRLFIACLSLLLPAAAFAGAWLQPKDHGQFIAQATYFTNNQFFDQNGNLVGQSRFTKYEFQPYVEYGLLDNLTIGATAYLQRDIQAASSNNGIADPEFFLRTNLWKGEKELISIQPLIKIGSWFESNGTPRGGSFSTDYELSVLYGRNLTILSDKDYLDIRAGYRHRSGTLSDQWRGDAALGVNISDRWIVIPAARAIVAAKYSGAAFSENGAQDYDLYKIELGAHYRLSNQQTIGITAFDHVYGAQTGNGVGVIVGYMQGF